MKDILIVEDNSDERERLKTILEEQGYSLTACGAAEKAEKLLSQEQYRLIILDIGLGDKSGSYLFNSITAGSQQPQIIIFTGNPSVHLKERFLQSGAVDYVVKGSVEAKKDNILRRVLELIGEPASDDAKGIELGTFVNLYVAQSSRNLFYDKETQFPKCDTCGSRSYQVVFFGQPQLPPEIQGEVKCQECGALFEGSVG